MVYEKIVSSLVHNWIDIFYPYNEYVEVNEFFMKHLFYIQHFKLNKKEFAIYLAEMMRQNYEHQLPWPIGNVERVLWHVENAVFKNNKIHDAVWEKYKNIINITSK